MSGKTGWDARLDPAAYDIFGKVLIEKRHPVLAEYLDRQRTEMEAVLLQLRGGGQMGGVGEHTARRKEIVPVDEAVTGDGDDERMARRKVRVQELEERLGLIDKVRRIIHTSGP